MPELTSKENKRREDECENINCNYQGKCFPIKCFSTWTITFIIYGCKRHGKTEALTLL